MLTIRAALGAGLVYAGTLAGFAGTLGATSTAAAQMRMSGSRGMGGAEISKSSVEQYAKVLRLDAAQREAALMLQETYSEATRRATDEMQQSMKSVREEASDGDFTEFGEKMPKIMDTMGKKRSAAQEAFLKDLREILTPAQVEAWPALERLRRRQSQLSFGMVSGSSVDLTTVVDSLKLPEAESRKLAGAMEQYEFDMDRLLQERERDDAAKKEKFDFNPANFDMEKMRAGMDEARAQALKVRDLNKKYERQIASLLPDDARAKFASEVRARSFRKIYSEPHVAKMLDAALGFDDLDPTQKKQIVEMRAQYQKELDDANAKWAATLEQAESEGKAGGMPFMGGGGESDELKSARQARRDLDKKFSERVRTALNDKQRERLPKKESGDRMVHFGEGGDGEGGGVFIQAVEIDDGEGVQSDVQVIVAPGGG